jgi:hypothetical protein
MELIKHGTVRQGTIVFTDQVPLPEGTEVVVHIEPLGEPSQPLAVPETEDSSALPVFGMWADREEMTDSVAWVCREREKWPQRNQRQD